MLRIHLGFDSPAQKNSYKRILTRRVRFNYKVGKGYFGLNQLEDESVVSCGGPYTGHMYRVKAFVICRNAVAMKKAPLDMPHQARHQLWFVQFHGATVIIHIGCMANNCFGTLIHASGGGARPKMVKPPPPPVPLATLLCMNIQYLFCTRVQKRCLFCQLRVHGHRSRT